MESDENWPMNNDEQDSACSVDLTELELALKYGKREDHYDAIDKLIALGTQALPLVDLVAEMYKADRLNAASSSLYKLYVATHHEGLLDVLREKAPFHRCCIEEKCLLVSEGFRELEPDLLQFLYDDWKNLTSCWREEVVRSLGKGGGHESLKLLERIHVMLLECVLTDRMKVVRNAPSSEIPPHILEQIEVAMDEHGNIDPSKCRDFPAVWEALLRAQPPVGEVKRNTEFLNIIKHSIEQLRRRLGPPS